MQDFSHPAIYDVIARENCKEAIDKYSQIFFNILKADILNVWSNLLKHERITDRNVLIHTLITTLIQWILLHGKIVEFSYKKTYFKMSCADNSHTCG